METKASYLSIHELVMMKTEFNSREKENSQSNLLLWSRVKTSEQRRKWIRVV